MTKEKSKYEFSGLPIYDIVGQPLIAVARAQSMMAKEQLKAMMESCFRFDGNVYDPILLKMNVTRSSVEPGRNAGENPYIEQTTTTFYVPMITIFPFNSLGIENVDIDFTVDITSQYVNNTAEEESSIGSFLKNKTSKVEWLGKISRSENPRTMDETSKMQNTESGSSMHINVEAGTLPLTRGLLEIINIYTNSFHVNPPQQQSLLIK